MQVGIKVKRTHLTQHSLKEAISEETPQTIEITICGANAVCCMTIFHITPYMNLSILHYTAIKGL
jgi:hypothetical protein